VQKYAVRVGGGDNHHFGLDDAVLIEDIIDDTRTRGSITAGGRLADGEGYFIRPTIVRDIEDQARLVRAEQFDPVLPILSYEGIDEVLAWVNDSEYGLGGAVWTSAVERRISVAGRIESGTVWVNRHRVLPFDIPFGGAKQLGMGLQKGGHRRSGGLYLTAHCQRWPGMTAGRRRASVTLHSDKGTSYEARREQTIAGRRGITMFAARIFRSCQACS
jgi:delta 1-pyrroline-5-carboxylate dehydrogenase